MKRVKTKKKIFRKLVVKFFSCTDIGTFQLENPDAPRNLLCNIKKISKHVGGRKKRKQNKDSDPQTNEHNAIKILNDSSTQ